MIRPLNVQARERRRQKLKEEFDCIPVPPSDHQVPKLTLKENFGWRVLEKTHVESYFPPLTRHYEKPDTSGNFEKVTYVLHMGGPATVVERNTVVKDAQTYVRERKPKKKVEEVATPKEPSLPKPLSPKPSYVTWANNGSFEERKKVPSEFSVHSKPSKLISTFYYKKRKGRSRSRSAKKSNDRNSKQDHSPHNNPKESGDVHLESAKDALLRHLKEERELNKSVSGDNAQMSASIDVRKEATRARFNRIERRGHDEDMARKKLSDRESPRSVSKKSFRRQLRAGASESEAEKKKVRTKEELMISESLKITAVDFGGGEPSEELLKTPTGTNKYLYVPKKKERAEQTA